VSGDFFLLTGALGSGKTTLLRDFLATSEAADTAVIVNEAGEIDIDGAILAETDSKLPMALLANGCVCCSIGNDLLYTVEALVASRAAPFRRIVLECSGLARPGPILASLGGLGPLGMRVGVVATYDAARPPLEGALFAEAAAQLAAAQVIVATKLDRAGLDRDSVAAINPLAEVVVEADAAVRAGRAFAAIGRGRMPEVSGVAGHKRVGVLRAVFDPAPSVDALLEWLENLAGLCGERLLRVKGVVTPMDAPPLLIQAVGPYFDPPRRFEGAAAAGLVVIVRDVPVAEIAAMQPGFAVRLTAAAKPTARGGRPVAA